MGPSSFLGILNLGRCRVVGSFQPPISSMSWVLLCLLPWDSCPYKVDLFDFEGRP